MEDGSILVKWILIALVSIVSLLVICVTYNSIMTTKMDNAAIIEAFKMGKSATEFRCAKVQPAYADVAGCKFLTSSPQTN